MQDTLERISKVGTSDIIKVFHSEQTPLHAMVRLSQYSLTWLVSKLFRNQQNAPLQLLPFQSVLLDMMWSRKHVMVLMSRGAGKTYMLALYALLRAILCPGSEIVIVGAGLRQSMKVFSYIVKLYNQSPLIQESLKKYGGPRIVMTGPYIEVGYLSRIIALPIGDGEKIRGQRATNLEVDEFGSLSESVFETAIRPFASVHADPEQRVRIREFLDRIKGLGAGNGLIDQLEDMQGYGNQFVLAGTSNYEFNHFYKYYQTYQMIIASKGDPYLIQKAIENQRSTKSDMVSRMSRKEIDILAKGWKNYVIFEMPYYEVPRGFLDEENIMHDKATMSPIRFGMEYEMKWAKDSDGFIKRSSINDATCVEEDKFEIELFGEAGKEYVMGLDPARHNDNFGCVILKLVPGGSQVVYVDAWRGKDTPTSARKIRDLMSRFNIVRIAIDQGGGGDAIADTLQLKELCQDDELPIYPVKEQIEDKAMLAHDGHFILELVRWTSQWISVNAHALNGDIQHRRLLFPPYPELPDLHGQYNRRFLKGKRSMTDDEKRQVEDMVFGREDQDFDKIEDGIWDHIQAVIDETCAIERTVTPGGVEKFELPTLAEQREGMDVRRRDRFSALVLAAYAVRMYRDMDRYKKPLKSGGSPHSILSKRKRSGRKVVRRGNVMY